MLSNIMERTRPTIPYHTEKLTIDVPNARCLYPNIEVILPQNPINCEVQPIQKLPFSDTVSFLQQALEAGVIDKITQDKDTYDTSYLTEGFEIVDRYFNTQDSLGDIGERFRISATHTMRRRNETMRNIFVNSPPELQEKYPFEALQLAKPRTTSSKIKASMSQNSHIKEIIRDIKLGTTVEEIAKTYDLTANALVNRRKKLKELGINFPHQVRKYYDVAPEILSAAKSPELTDEESIDLLQKMSESFYGKHSGADGILASLKECVENAGFRYNPSTAYKFADALQRAKVPFGSLKHISQRKDGRALQQTRRFLFRRHFKRAQNSFLNSPDLSKYR
jgi:hypothetical protein